ncbi:uncharacterized protein LOC129588008 [Paramacrobiotus metropolitanus]|uniref:uncharacterized protein LOC129588008 n=1 Tax=Paramacrobiotus metropolitanus TaxID=2943436 RepID=UPI0024465CFD|nr:uncharacterized protein LOC129588008 [Paramacrobiotus metropolitanus]XP_055337991.1 uncharacterized protein LOC129588008 [Paramacrobiotus metropolitanus]XP_055337997.1 uncharacterized protein LOC129588008 [Paramacrobiotus metropolitanus]
MWKPSTNTAPSSGTLRSATEQTSMKNAAGATAGSASPLTQTYLARFLKILQPYEATREWLRKRIEQQDFALLVQEEEFRKTRNNFIILTIKAIRRDPKILKSKYEDVFWKELMYPLIRGLADKLEFDDNNNVQLALREHIACGHAAFQGFIEAALTRFSFQVGDFNSIPVALECSSDLGYNADQVSWIGAFLSRCLCCIGDLYRYSYKYNYKNMVPASQYYELASLTRPSDGRAVSCIGIVQKDIGEPFAASYYYLLSACKKSKYGFYLKNLESIHGQVEDLCTAYGAGLERPSIDQDSREIIKGFSVNVLNVVFSLLVDSEPPPEKISQIFGISLEYLSASLRQPVPDSGEWRDAMYTNTTYLHPDLLWKICLMMIETFYLKKSEADVSRGQSFNSLCAFLVTMIGKITTYVVQCIQYWLNYTSFHLIPEPDPNAVVKELCSQLNVPKTSGFASVAGKQNGRSYNSQNFVSCNTAFDDHTVDTENLLNRFAEGTQLDSSMETFWSTFCQDQSSEKLDRFDFDIQESMNFAAGTGQQSSYLKAFAAFNETLIHLPLVHLFYQWIRCDDEMWTFCTVNFPDVICNFVDIINLLSIPKFVTLYVKEQNIDRFPLEEEILLRETVLMDKWLSTLDWNGFYRRRLPVIKMENMILLNYRFLDMANMLRKTGLAVFDSAKKKWICTLSRKNLGNEVVPDRQRKLLVAQKLGRAWFAEEAKEREKEVMNRRADLPKYLVIDTSCFVRKLEWVQRLYACKLFKIVVPAYVLEELDKDKKSKQFRDAIRWLEKSTDTKDFNRVEIQKWKDMHKYDVELRSDWENITHSEKSVRVMVDCAKFFSEEVKRQTDDSPDYGLHIRVLTDLDLQSVYCARVIDQMDRLEMPHEIKLMRIHDFMGWLDEGPGYFRRMQEQEDLNRIT